MLIMFSAVSSLVSYRVWHYIRLIIIYRKSAIIIRSNINHNTHYSRSQTLYLVDAGEIKGTRPPAVMPAKDHAVASLAMMMPVETMADMEPYVMHEWDNRMMTALPMWGMEKVKVKVQALVLPHPLIIDDDDDDDDDNDNNNNSKINE